MYKYINIRKVPSGVVYFFGITGCRHQVLCFGQERGVGIGELYRDEIEGDAVLDRGL
jgi:hypothetical protein